MVKKRNTLTKKNIKNSLIKLMQEKGFENLTVSDIARDSNINRGTFYLHYIDKYDLLEKLEAEIINELKLILLSNINSQVSSEALGLIPYDAILAALYYVKGDFDFVYALASDGGHPSFIQMVKSILNELITSHINQSTNLHFTKKQLPDDYAKEILLSSVVSIIILWIKKGAIESPEDIATMITKAKQISPYELLL